MNSNLNELKFQIQSELQKDGTVENMKLQLRYKLLERLQLQQKKPIFSSQQEQKQDSLPRRVASSLIADFLRQAGLDYCLSVFIPESGYDGALLEREELAILLKVDTEQIKSIGILQGLCNDILMIKPREVQKYNSSTQTYTGDAVMNLEDKLNRIDQSFRVKIEGELLKPHQEIEERLLKMKKDYDIRMKTELQAEITRIREFECQTIRMEENEKSRNKMQEYREELEHQYQERLQKLREREKDLMEKASSKAREVETMSYNYRQKIIKESEILRMKEQEVQKERELNDENLKLQKQRLESRERELQRKIEALDEQTYQKNILKIYIYQRNNYNKKYQNDMHINRIDVQNELHEEQEQLRKKQKMVDQELLQTQQLKDSLDNVRKENKQLIIENDKYVEQIKELNRKKRDLENEISNLKDSNRTIENMQRRDQDLSRKWESELKYKEDELKILRQTIDHKEQMINDHKLLQTENVKKLTREIQQYQDKIEAQEQEIKQLKQDLSEKENIYPNQQVMLQQSMKVYNPMVDSLVINHNIKDHNKRINILQNEMADNKIRRQEEMRRLQEDWHSDKSVFQIKFKEAWDLHGSSVEYSQAPQIIKKNAIQTSASQMSGSKAKQSNDDPFNIFKQLDEAQSQVFQSEYNQKTTKNYKNIIEETYQEGYD